MKQLEKQLLRKQADVYLNWREKHGCDSRYADWITLFVNSCTKIDILDVTADDIQDFLDLVQEVSNTQSQQIVGKKAVMGFVGYYRARNKNGLNRGRRGRSAHLSDIERVQKYLGLGLKVWEVERLTGKKPSWISRVRNYIMPTD